MNSRLPDDLPLSLRMRLAQGMEGLFTEAELRVLLRVADLRAVLKRCRRYKPGRWVMYRYAEVLDAMAIPDEPVAEPVRRRGRSRSLELELDEIVVKERP